MAATVDIVVYTATNAPTDSSTRRQDRRKQSIGPKAKAEGSQGDTPDGRNR